MKYDSCNGYHIVVRFTQKNLLRIYPKGTRVTSSNYNPLRGWIHGAQMVALNMQVLHNYELSSGFLNKILLHIIQQHLS